MCLNHQWLDDNQTDTQKLSLCVAFRKASLSFRLQCNAVRCNNLCSSALGKLFIQNTCFSKSKFAEHMQQAYFTVHTPHRCIWLSQHS